MKLKRLIAGTAITGSLGDDAETSPGTENERIAPYEVSGRKLDQRAPP